VRPRRRPTSTCVAIGAASTFAEAAGPWNSPPLWAHSEPSRPSRTSGTRMRWSSLLGLSRCSEAQSVALPGGTVEVASSRRSRGTELVALTKQDERESRVSCSTRLSTTAFPLVLLGQGNKSRCGFISFSSIIQRRIDHRNAGHEASLSWSVVTTCFAVHAAPACVRFPDAWVEYAVRDAGCFGDERDSVQCAS